MAGRITVAEAAFARCMAVLGHHFTLRDVERNRMQADYEAARQFSSLTAPVVSW